MGKLRIAFMGTPDFALEALKPIHAGPHEVACVYTQPPRPKGRGHKVQPSPVHAFAQEQNIPVFHPKSLKSDEAQQEFAAHNVDVAIVAAYGLILPKAVLDAPKHGCINIHASLLPRWRGASPIQRAIWQGDSETGVTLMQMDEGLDTGPEIMKRACPITPETTAQSLHDELAALGAAMVAEALDTLAENGTLPNTPQNDAKATYAALLNKDDGKIDWTQNAKQVDRQIRALNPWPGTYSGEGDKRLKISKASTTINTQTGQYHQVGVLINKSGDVACGEGTILRLTHVQPAGKKPMDIASAINGGYLTIGETL